MYMEICIYFIFISQFEEQPTYKNAESRHTEKTEN